METGNRRPCWSMLYSNCSRRRPILPLGRISSRIVSIRNPYISNGFLLPKSTFVVSITTRDVVLCDYLHSRAYIMCNVGSSASIAFVSNCRKSLIAFEFSAPVVGTRKRAPVACYFTSAPSAQSNLKLNSRSFNHAKRTVLSTKFQIKLVES